jgi:hypothetical protein
VAIYLIGAVLLLMGGIVAGAHLALIWMFAEDEEPDRRRSVTDHAGRNGLWRAFAAWRRSKPPLIADQRGVDRSSPGRRPR